MGVFIGMDRLFPIGGACTRNCCWVAIRPCRCKATPRQDGVEEIRIPGERSQRERAQRLREGIEIDRQTYDALAGFAKGGVS